MRILIVIAFFFISLTGKGQETNNSLTIDFEITKYNNGNIYIALYDSKGAFLKTPLKGAITKVKNGKAIAKIEGLEKGEYAVSSFYDKNGNEKLDTNFLGIPKEPIAMSNNAKGSFGPPKYKDAKFTINSNTTIKIKF